MPLKCQLPEPMKKRSPTALDKTVGLFILVVGRSAQRDATVDPVYVVKPIRTTAAASQERLPAVVPRGAASSDSLSVVLVTFAA